MQKKIKGYKGKPYFIADNFKATKDGFELKKEISQVGSKKDIINTKNPNVSIHKNAQRQDLRRNYQVANICVKHTGYRFFY